MTVARTLWRQLFERPYLGFNGWMAFVDDLARTLFEAKAKPRR